MAKGHLAPELRVERWVDGKGKPTSPQTLAQRKGMFKVIFCFQAWCEGCHLSGFPALKQLIAAFEGDARVSFLAVQTVFEGAHANTWEAMLDNQGRYDLGIPFGHDGGEDGISSHIVADYGTGGTPWFLLIDRKDRLLFGGFQLDVEKAVAYIREVIAD